MSIYTKLMQARLDLQSRKLKKSGYNSYAKYDYFELGDFLPVIQEIFSNHGLCGVVSYGIDVAKLTITDTTDGQSIVIESPMSTCEMKGLHEVQRLGAVQTYLRRYLWVTAMEIVEHDAIDSSKPLDKKIIHSPTGTPTVERTRIDVILDVAEAIKERFAADDLIGAYEEYAYITDSEEKVALWQKLPSNVRSAIKKHGESVALDILTTN